MAIGRFLLHCRKHYDEPHAAHVVAQANDEYYDITSAALKSTSIRTFSDSLFPLKRLINERPVADLIV